MAYTRHIMAYTRHIMAYTRHIMAYTRHIMAYTRQKLWYLLFVCHNLFGQILFYTDYNFFKGENYA